MRGISGERALKYLIYREIGNFGEIRGMTRSRQAGDPTIRFSDVSGVLANLATLAILAIRSLHFQDLSSPTCRRHVPANEDGLCFGEGGD